MKKKTIIIVVLHVIALHNLMGEADDKNWKMPHVTGKDLASTYDKLGKVLASKALSETPKIFVGLPHPRWYPDLLVSEQKKSKIFKEYGFLFYSRLSRLTLSDNSVIVDLIKDASTYKRFGGFKKCGGYHPDFTLHYLKDGESVVTDLFRV